MPLARRATVHDAAGSGALRTALCDALQRVPARPILLDACATQFALAARPGAVRGDESLALRAFLKLRQALLDGAPRCPDLQGLWRNALATAHYATRLAEALALDVRAIAIGALLHEAGEMRVVAAIARAEVSTAEKITPEACARLRSEHCPEALERLLQAWAITGPTADTVRQWRGGQVGARPACGAAVVQAAHRLALAHSAPAHAPPGLAEAARAELMLDADLQVAADADATVLTRLLTRVG